DIMLSHCFLASVVLETVNCGFIEIFGASVKPLILGLLLDILLPCVMDNILKIQPLHMPQHFVDEEDVGGQLTCILANRINSLVLPRQVYIGQLQKLAFDTSVKDSSGSGSSSSRTCY
ncbi:hypothetical protein STEG23_033892, partial [Scotinomys teguina]